MKEGRPSTTAMFVAAARAVAGVDPFAERLVPRGFTALMKVASFGLVRHLRARTNAIDAAVTAARAEQVVVLGAGLDARAWRLEACANAIVYEVDHPATQAFKRRRLDGARPIARDVVFVGVDFERDDLEARLAAAGHDTSLRTSWIWEGVTPYLTHEATEATLAIASRRSAPTSMLAMSYVTPSLAHVPRALRPLAKPIFRLVGEPLRGFFTPADAAALLGRHGFAPTSDDSLGRGIDERLVVGARR